MSKNIQKEIFVNKKIVDPVDFSNPTNLHVINRNNRRESTNNAEDSEELKKF